MPGSCDKIRVSDDLCVEMLVVILYYTGLREDVRVMLRLGRVRLARPSWLAEKKAMSVRPGKCDLFWPAEHYLASARKIDQVPRLGSRKKFQPWPAKHHLAPVEKIDQVPRIAGYFKLICISFIGMCGKCDNFFLQLLMISLGAHG